MLFCVGLAISGGSGALSPFRLHDLMVCLDLCALGLLLFVGYAAGTGTPLAAGVPLAAGCAAALLGLIVRRMNRSLGVRDWGVLVLAFGGILGAMLLVLSLPAAPAGQAMVMLWNRLVAAGRRIAQVLFWLLMQVFRLVPDTDMNYAVPELEELPQVEVGPPGSPLLLIVLGTVVTIGTVAYFVWKLARTRIGGRKSRKAGGAGIRHSRISLWKALKRLWAALQERVRLGRWLRQARNTPEGLFYRLERRCRAGPWHRRTAETPREFLQRLSRSAEADRELQEALQSLIPLVEEALFASAPPGRTVPDGAMIRRKIGRAVVRQSVQEKVQRVRTWIREYGSADRKERPRSPGTGKDGWQQRG